jgi:uncharacterized protein (DUF1330 family)
VATYVLAQLEVSDREQLRRYVKAAAPTVAAYGGVGLFVDDEPQVLEGEWFGPRTIALRFESPGDAERWYRSEEYQAAIALRAECARTNLVFVQGV